MRRRLKVGVAQSDVVIVGAARGAMKRVSRAAFDDFVRSHPTAQVQDVADALLAGLVLEANGSTARGYLRIYERLLRTRRRLGVRAPRKHSVARYRP
jgi:predicted nucleic acid-binding protein